MRPLHCCLLFLLGFFRVPAAAAENYLPYYQAIVTAEEAVIAGRYQEGLQQYTNTFAAYTFSHPIDCYVAAQVAGYMHDSSACVAFLRRGVAFGLPLPTIAANPHLAGYVREGLLGQAQLDSCWRMYLGRIDRTAREKALALFRFDQTFIRHLPAGPLYESDGSTLLAIYRPVYDSLLAEIVGLIKTHGFPAQRLIGTQNGDDGFLRIGPHAAFVYYILIHHGNAWPQLKELLWDELLKGNISPLMYGALADHSDANRGAQAGRPYMALRECETKACSKELRSRRAALDAARKSIGLGSYELMKARRSSSMRYRKWCRQHTRTPEPFFDFQDELHFQGVGN